MPQKKVTIREVASAAQVSIGTVSRALAGQPGLSEQTRAEVLRVAREMGYDVGKLRSGRPRRILFVYNRQISSLTSNQFYSPVLHGAEAACREASVSLSLLSVAGNDHIAAAVRRHDAEALIASGFLDDESLQALRHCDLPLVLVDHYHAALRCINMDNVQGAWLATRHLIEGGAKRPAMIVGALAHHGVALRVKGFRRALFEAGRLADPELEATMDLSLPYDEAGREAMRRLLALPERPDAVFAYNDATALTAMAVCREAGLRIPEDIRFVGYDDIAAAARSHPPLSTIRVDKDALGAAAVAALMDGPTTPGNTLQPVELVVRDSSRPPAERGAQGTRRQARGARG